MHARKSTIGPRPLRATPAFTAAPPPDTTPERPAHAVERRPWPTPGDTTAPAERVRITDVPARGRGRAYLVERELERDGYDAVKALIADYLQQARLLEDIPMAVSPLTGIRSETHGGVER